MTTCIYMYIKTWHVITCSMPDPIPVVLTSVADDKQRVRLASYGAAAKYLNDREFNGTKALDSSAIRRAVDRNRALQGWVIRPDRSSAAGAITAAGPSGADTINPLTFVFGAEAAEVFRGKTVRVTEDKRVSVYDVIKVVSGVDQPNRSFEQLCAQNEEVLTACKNFQFPGQGQRPTPVTDIESMLHIINLLPGANAARFRAGGAKLLVRYLGGDERLIDEVRAIQEHHASGASQGTIGQLFQEAAQQVPVPALSAPTHRFQFMSPSMAGQDMHAFVDKAVCYLLTFELDGAQYLKFGYTTDAHKRMTDHMREIPGVQLWYMLESAQARKIEDEFRKKMRYMGHLIELQVKSKKLTEIVNGISPEVAEQILLQLHDACNASDDERLQLKLAKIELRKAELTADVHKAELTADVRKAELTTDVRKAELVMQQARLQVITLFLERTDPNTIPPDTFLRLLCNQ
jgi:hypothetical protein